MFILILQLPKNCIEGGMFKNFIKNDFYKGKIVLKPGFGF